MSENPKAILVPAHRKPESASTKLMRASDVRVLPSNHQLISDAKLTLSRELERLASLQGNDSLGEREKLTILKTSALTIDSIFKATKALAAIKDVEDNADRLSINGKRFSDLTDAEVFAALGMRRHPPSPGGPPVVDNCTTQSEMGTNSGADAPQQENDDE